MCCSCGGKWVNLSLFKAIRHSPMPTHSWYSADTYGSPPWYKMMFHGHHPKDSFLMVCPCAWPRHNKVMHGAELVFVCSLLGAILALRCASLLLCVLAPCKVPCSSPAAYQLEAGLQSDLASSGWGSGPAMLWCCWLSCFLPSWQSFTSCHGYEQGLWDWTAGHQLLLSFAVTSTRRTTMWPKLGRERQSSFSESMTMTSPCGQLLEVRSKWFC